MNGQWADYVDIPLGEIAEAYEVDVMDGGTVVPYHRSIFIPTHETFAANLTAQRASGADNVVTP